MRVLNLASTVVAFAAALALDACGSDEGDGDSAAKDAANSEATSDAAVEATSDAPACIGTSAETERSYDDALAAATDGCVIGDLGGDSSGSMSFDWGTYCIDGSIQVWRHAGDGEDTEPYAWVRVAPGQTAEVQSEPADSSRFYSDEECSGDLEDLSTTDDPTTAASEEPSSDGEETIGATPASKTCDRLNDYASIEVERDYPKLAEETDSTELASALRDYVVAWKEGDYEALVSLWTEDLTDACADAGVKLRQD